MSFKFSYFFQNGCQAAQICRLCGREGLALGNRSIFGAGFAASLHLGGFNPAGDSDRADAEFCGGFLLGTSFILRFPFGDKIKNGLLFLRRITPTVFCIVGVHGMTSGIYLINAAFAIKEK
ncbi:hypothetical protein [Akkermansia sp.]|uniref:hypothetical protein n=1 Tax=Akkermansia sp. TaxID=1872421 RepID=UPI003AAAF660